MNKFKLFLAKTFFKELIPYTQDSESGGNIDRELASEFVKRISYKETNDTEFEHPDYDFKDIQTGYDTDSYIRQGVDKYVDQIFKEGYNFYGTDENAVQYLKLRLAYIAEATQTPTDQLLIDIAEDIVKYGNCMMIKARSNDPNAFPEGADLAGLNGKDPVAGYFCANPVTIKCQRDDYGTVMKWQQDNDKGKQEFDPNDVVHFYYKREKGKAYGTPFLVPVIDDVKALRRAEENVLKMMYRNIYPFYHVAVGTEEVTGTKEEVEHLQEVMENADLEMGVVTTERVVIKPIASDKVIEASPYLKYMEERVFSGMGIPGIMWGRGNTSNRSTGDNMTSEMADRIRAMSKVIEMFFNNFVIKELLMEGGYDPVLNPDQSVEFRFNDNDVDVEIKKQVHAIYKYEHNAITEDEMREELGMDPIPDGERGKLFIELITRETLKLQAQLDTQVANATETGTGETNNKEKNQGGSGNKKTTSKTKNARNVTVGLVKDSIEELSDNLSLYIKEQDDLGLQILHKDIIEKIVDCSAKIRYIISRDTDLSTLDEDFITSVSSNLAQQIYTDMLGKNLDANSISEFDDIVNIRIDIFKDSVLRHFSEAA